MSDKWFYRGREARGRGEPRQVSDGRLSSESRQQWYAGWDEENRLQQPPPTAEQIAESSRVVDRLKAFAAGMRAKP